MSAPIALSGSAPQVSSGPATISYQATAALSAAPLAAPLLEYHDRDRGVPEAILGKTIGGFALGCMLMGIMLNIARVLLDRHYDLVAIPTVEAVGRTLFLVGMGFVGCSLLLVVLKAREEWSRFVLHARHPVLAMASGAGYAAAVFGPALGGPAHVTLEQFCGAGVWMLLLAYPIAAAYWMVVRRQPRAA